MAVLTRYVHPTKGRSSRRGYAGYSWTTFFFSGFPALFRGDFLGFIVGLAVLVGADVAIEGVWFVIGERSTTSAGENFGLLAGLVAGVSVQALWAHHYNGWHTKRLVENGWVRAEPLFEGHSDGGSHSSETGLLPR